MSSSFLKFGWTPAGYNKGDKKETRLSNEAWDARKKAAANQTERSKFLRDRWQRLYKPMEEGLAAEVTAGYNPNYAAVRSGAMQDTDESFARSDAGNNRNSARMGLTINPADSAEIQRLGDLDKTSAKVFAANSASNMARDRSEEMTAKRGAQMIALGQQRPYLASGESLAGDSAIADMLDYDVLRQARANKEFADADTQNAAGSSFRDGGSVTKPMRKGLTRVYADGRGVSSGVDDGRDTGIDQPGFSEQPYIVGDQGQPKASTAQPDVGIGQPSFASQPDTGTNQPIYNTGGSGTDMGIGQPGYNTGAPEATRVNVAQPVKTSYIKGNRGASKFGLGGGFRGQGRGRKMRNWFADGGRVSGMDGDDEHDKQGSGLQLSGEYRTFSDKDARGGSGGGRVGYRSRLGDGDLTVGTSFGGVNAKFAAPEGTKKVREFDVTDADVNYRKGQNAIGANVGRGHAGIRYRREFADGGSVFDTARLKNLHTEEYSQGQTDKQFPEWLEENGYMIGADGQVKRDDTVVAEAPRRPDNRVRTPDFLFEPREYQKKQKNYAEGGLVEESPVELESEDFIIPADVVHKFGTDYFDAMVSGEVVQ